MGNDNKHKLPKFDVKEDDWESYRMLVELILEEKEITEDRKKKLEFVQACGSETFKLINTLLQPKTAKSASFEEILSVLDKYFEPQKSITMSRYDFISRRQKAGESMTDYLKELKRLAIPCKFGTSFDERLRDQIIVGVLDENLIKRLLSEPKLDTFQKAVDIALNTEFATHTAKRVKDRQSVNSEVEEQVNLIRLRKPATNWSRTASTSTPASKCYCCGRNGHFKSECRERFKFCAMCGKKCHAEKLCRGTRGKPMSVNEIEDDQPENQNFAVERYDLEIGAVSQPETYEADDYEPPDFREVRIQGEPLKLLCDTGTAYTLIPHNFHLRLKQTPILEPLLTPVRSYTKQNISILGMTTYRVSCGNIEKNLRALVVQDGRSLMGRNWLKAFGIYYREHGVNEIEMGNGGCAQLLKQYADVFSEELGCFKGPQLKLEVKEGAVPPFNKARSVPFAKRKMAEEALEKLVRTGVLKPVRFAEAAAPVVYTPKGEKAVRVCADLRTTANKVTRLEQYPLPRAEDLFACMDTQGQTKFTKLDLKDAYSQFEMHPQSKWLTTINTHKGLFEYNRIPNGVSSAPAFFQRTLESVLAGIPGTGCRLDDILISGPPEQHKHRLEEVLRRMRKHNLKLGLAKCQFMQDEIEFLGHKLSDKGLKPLESKVKAIEEAAKPTSKEQVQSFLGMISYYAKFIPNRASSLTPLYKLIQKEEPFEWNQEQEKAFEYAKKAIVKSKGLVSFNRKRPLVLTCDASPYGIGSVLAHMADGEEQPIAFASPTLTAAEKNYPQIEREALAIWWSVTVKFREYLLGHHFTLRTDHQPLVTLFGNKKPISQHSANRIQKWSLSLNEFAYTIQYKTGKTNVVADALSRLPLREEGSQPRPSEEVFLIEDLQKLPLRHSDLKKATEEDQELKYVLDHIKGGKPFQPSKCSKQLFAKQHELSTMGDVLIWHGRVIVPEKLQPRVLQQLHEGHGGSTRMKRLARRMVWFAGIDRQLERTAAECETCQRNATERPRQNPVPWKPTAEALERVHIDFLGPWESQFVLVIVDVHTKWIEAKVTKTTSTEEVIRVMEEFMTNFGKPRLVVSDNGSCFTSQEWVKFLEAHHVAWRRSPAYHPSSNGSAEKAVGIVKSYLKKNTAGTLRQRLTKFLYHYRSSPNGVDAKTPAERMFGRQFRSEWNLLKEPERETLSETNQLPKPVWLRDVLRKKWTKAGVLRAQGKATVVVRTEDGRERLAHNDHVRERRVPAQVRGGTSRSTACDDIVWGRFTSEEEDEETAAGPEAKSEGMRMKDTSEPQPEEERAETSDEEEETFEEAVEEINPEPIATSREKRKTKQPERYGWS